MFISQCHAAFVLNLDPVVLYSCAAVGLLMFKDWNVAHPSCQPPKSTFNQLLKIALDFINNWLPFSCDTTRKWQLLVSLHNFRRRQRRNSELDGISAINKTTRDGTAGCYQWETCFCFLTDRLCQVFSWTQWRAAVQHGVTERDRHKVCAIIFQG